MNVARQSEADQLLSADRFRAFVAVRPDAPGTSDGPLRGLRFAVKDNIGVSGLPFTAGLPLFSARIATKDAAVVRRLRSAGGRILGVTRTDSGGFGVTTPEVVNPIALDCIVGGSTGGAAAAVAARLADLGVGTDTGGSVRIPAACCGLFAFKPSYGRIAVDGVWPLAPSLDHVGLLSRDLKALLKCAGVLLDELDGYASAAARSPCFGVDFERADRCAPMVKQCFLAAIDRLDKAGFLISPIRLLDRDTVVETHGVLVLTEARKTYSELWPGNTDRFSTAARRALSIAYELPAARMSSARRIADRIESEFVAIFDVVDAILTPTLPVLPPAIGSQRVTLGDTQVPIISTLVAETCLANLCGSPAIAMPLRPLQKKRSCLPGSLQIMTARGDDAFALHCCGVVQAALVLGRASQAFTLLAQQS